MTVARENNHDVEDLFPSARTQLLVEIEQEGGLRFVRLLLERFPDGRGHFHLDIVFPGVLAPSQRPNCTLEQIQEHCERLIGKTLPVKFESRFMIPPGDVTQNSLLGAWSHVALNAGGVQTTLSAGNIRLGDSIYKEIKWRPGAARASEPVSVVDIIGHLGPYPISRDLFAVVRARAEEGLARFVRVRPNEQQGQQP